jgi:hypothetical protein
MADHFHAKEFGVAGELSIPRPAEPGTVMFTPRFVIPEVDWQAEREEREAREREEAVRAIARIPITTEAADQLEPADAPPRPDRPAQPQRRGPRNAAA